jgi:hypothetical protein
MKKWPAILIANAIIWGLVIVGSALRLKHTDAFAEIQGILGGGAIGALFLLMVGIVVPEKSKKRRPRKHR